MGLVVHLNARTMHAPGPSELDARTAETARDARAQPNQPAGVPAAHSALRAVTTPLAPGDSKRITCGSTKPTSLSQSTYSPAV